MKMLKIKYAPKKILNKIDKEQEKNSLIQGDFEERREEIIKG